MPKPIALQLYTLRDRSKDDFVGTLKAVADIGYPAVEMAGLYGRTAAEVRRILDDLGMVACGAHAPLTDPTKWEPALAEAQTLGYKHIGCAYIPAEQFNDPKQIKENAEKLEKAAAYFRRFDIRTFYHNHDWEFSGPNKGDLLLESAPSLDAEIDIYWVKTGGADPVEVLRRYARRVHLIHVKDGPCDRNKAMTAVGKGKVDVPAAIRAAEYGELEYNIVELDRCDTDMLQAVRDSYDYMVGHGLATGKR